MAGGVALALVALGGCGDDAPSVDGYDAAPGCPAVMAALPARVADQDRVKVRGDGRRTAAAWGDPAIVLRCGVGEPEEFDKFAACQRANGVDWFVPDRIIEDQSADVVMTTIGRAPRIEVQVPASYRPSTAVMVDLGAAIKAHTRETSPCS